MNAIIASIRGLVSTIRASTRKTCIRFKSHRPDHYSSPVNIEGNAGFTSGQDEAQNPSRTDSTQSPPKSGGQSRRFPVIIRHRKIEA